MKSTPTSYSSDPATNDNRPRSTPIWTLRTLLPCLILLSGLSVILGQYFVTRHIEASHFRQDSTQRLHAVGNRLKHLTPHLSSPNQLPMLNEEIAMVKKMAKLEYIAFVDTDGTILASTQPDWEGEPVASTLLVNQFPATREHQSLLQDQVSELNNGNQLLGSFAFESIDNTTNKKTDNTSASATPDLGLILTAMDLNAPLQVMQNRVNKIAAFSGALVFLIAGLLWLALNQLLSKPLKQLITMTRGIANGDYSEPTKIQYRNELGEISTALNQLRTTTQEREDALESSTRLARILENSHSEIYSANATTYQILNANTAARKNLGYASDEIRTLLPWDFVDGLTAQNIEQILAPLHDGTQDALDFETRLKRKDGTTYPVELRLQYMDTQTPPIYTVIAKDISEKLDQRKAIALRERAIDSMDVGISITDATKEEYPLVYVNQTLCDLSGYSADELIGQPVRMLQKDNQHQVAHQKIEEAQAKGEAVQVQFTSTRQDGTQYSDELSLSPITNEKGEVTHYIGVNRDVTEKLDTEKRLRQAQKIEAIGQLSSGIAHDFNNLLSVVGGNIEFLAMDIKDAELRECLNDADNAVQAGARLTRRLLTFARQRDLNVSVVQVNKLVYSALELLRSTIGETITVTSNLATDLWTVQADPSEIENTVVNLAINARDAMPDGGTISIDTSNVTIEDELGDNAFDLPAGDYIRLSVSDNGSGMSDEIKAKIFEPFFTTKEAGKGTGLGLASIFGFTKQSGGHVNVYSELGQGTVINVYLPRFTESPVDTKTPKLQSPTPTPAKREGRILVVEDNDLVRKTTLKRLNALGFITEQACNGKEAIALMEKDAKFDLVLSDIVMEGGVSGYDVAHWIHTNHPDCKILLTSGFNEQMVHKNGREVESLKVLQKPYNLAELEQAINGVLSQSTVSV